MAKSAKSSGPSQRQLRIAELIRHALAEMLSRGEIHDEVLSRHVVTVPEVRLSTDLKLATCYIMPLGGRDIDAVLKALNNHRRFIRGEIGHRVNAKFAPEIRFLADQSFAEAERVDALLYSDKVRQDILKQPLRIQTETPDDE